MEADNLGIDIDKLDGLDNIKPLETSTVRFESDFVDTTLVEFDIGEGRKFGYKPTTTDDETVWLPDYMIKNEEGKHTPDIAELSKCKIRNIVSVPYDRETIKKITGVNKDWNEMNKDERWDLIGKLDPKIYNKIVLAMDKIDNPHEEEKKIS